MDSMKVYTSQRRSYGGDVMYKVLVYLPKKTVTNAGLNTLRLATLGDATESESGHLDLKLHGLDGQEKFLPLFSVYNRKYGPKDTLAVRLGLRLVLATVASPGGHPFFSHGGIGDTLKRYSDTVLVRKDEDVTVSTGHSKIFQAKDVDAFWLICSVWVKSFTMKPDPEPTLSFLFDELNSRSRSCSNSNSAKSSQSLGSNKSLDPSFTDSTMAAYMKGLYQERQYEEYTLVAGKVSVPFHQDLMALHSPVFKRMKRGDWQENQRRCLDLSHLLDELMEKQKADIKAQHVLENVVNFIYGWNLQLVGAEAVIAMAIAHFLQMDKLLASAQDCAIKTLTVESCPQALALAFILSRQEDLQLANEVEQSKDCREKRESIFQAIVDFALFHFTEVSQSAGWNECFSKPELRQAFLKAADGDYEVILAGPI